MKIFKTTWAEHETHLKGIREAVFLKEQQVPVHDEWDDNDATATHYLLSHNKLFIGCARAYPLSEQTIKIGRVAILKPYRKQGFGNALMSYIIKDIEQQNVREIQLDAQTYIQAWYETLAFQAYGEPFLDAGIWHISMKKFV